ncbi:MAG: EamA family transporter, partial [Jatrophihabitans sp.]|uniref:EamA family transporter n=1 Tax=Jatrophihabitans sp. TaxID=1932789 RepID=UPI003F8022F3
MRSPVVLLQFIVLALTWGASFLFIKVGLEGLAPAQVVLGRLVAGAVTLLLLSAAGRRRRAPAGAGWGALGGLAVRGCGVAVLVFAGGER